MGFFSWLNDPMGTGAGKGQSETPVSKSRWFDLGNSRINAEDKNRRHRSNKQRKQDERDEKLRNSGKKPFFF